MRTRDFKAFGWDDGLMVVAMLLNIWFAIGGLAGSVTGIGKRSSEFSSISDVRAALWEKRWWLSQSAYVWVVCGARISIAMMLLHLAIQHARPSTFDS
ncbi:hypothetical protein IFM61606_10262 [Aspergillus udagawae]|uniref:Rhodopsin domain-containing protein n=1 Tax=Aspergillus udagawae TaxID=91492 RepID=A0ABQ1A0A5_9EURO|nr:hypothetical protein IFM51744_00534 [Aspergillus udagawae]GFF28945.1 hypothetical protein IFM61606_10262 [Aspergillus udagawae]GFF70452.1 hypothetical protein IFM53868_00311 [Aspergillus udagawae]GFG15910.1 hypothetical protein IFM5058_07693 [Aspergillus udagawae]